MSNSSTTTSALEKQDFLFLLDFIGRYAVDRCGAQEGVDMAIMSTLSVFPVFVWLTLQFLTFLRAEIYLVMNRVTITVLSVVQVVMLLAFHGHPPVVGCGPHNSYPNPQVALCAYLLVTFFCYSRDFHRQSLLSKLTVLSIFVGVTHSVLRVGFADGPATVAGALTGGVVACSFHEMVLHYTRRKPFLLSDVVNLFEKIFGYNMVDSMLGVEVQLHAEHGGKGGKPPTKSRAEGELKPEPINSNTYKVPASRLFVKPQLPNNTPRCLCMGFEDPEQCRQ